MLECGI